jgi:hypothetical protein
MMLWAGRTIVYRLSEAMREPLNNYFGEVGHAPEPSFPECMAKNAGIIAQQRS